MSEYSGVDDIYQTTERLKQLERMASITKEFDGYDIARTCGFTPEKKEQMLSVIENGKSMTLNIIATEIDTVRRTLFESLNKVVSPQPIDDSLERVKAAGRAVVFE